MHNIGYIIAELFTIIILFFISAIMELPKKSNQNIGNKNASYARDFMYCATLLTIPYSFKGYIHT